MTNILPIFTETPYSTAERIFNNYLDNIKSQICTETLELSENTEKLIIGINDFAIRKGHSYNTGIHDLRNETLLHLVKGRKLNELREDRVKHPQIYEIQPIAIVMDLVKYYHKFTEETFPKAIRIADRFHLNKYALDALQDVMQATIVFDKWLCLDKSLNIPEIDIAIKTFENWKQEIINYHYNCK